MWDLKTPGWMCLLTHFYFCFWTHTKSPSVVSNSPGIPHYMKEGRILELDMSSFVKRTVQCFLSVVSHIEAKLRASFRLSHPTSHTFTFSWGIFSIFFHDSRWYIIQQALVDLGCNKSLLTQEPQHAHAHTHKLTFSSIYAWWIKRNWASMNHTSVKRS